MKKIFSLIAAVLFAGSMMAESITISAENFKSTYSESTFTISEVEYAYTGAMYNGKGTPTNAAAKQFIQLRKSSSGAGEIKNKGALNLKSIVVATQNNQAFTLSAGTAADALIEVTKPTGTAGKYTCEHKEGGTLEFDVTLYTFDVSGKKYFDLLNGDKAQYLAYITIELEGGGEEESGCDWDKIDWFNTGLADTDENFNQFKVCKANENPNFVNIQTAPWADNNKGIYINFPSAEFSDISLAADQYKADGAGILLFLSAFTAKETDVVIKYQDKDCAFTIYNDKGNVPEVIADPVFAPATLTFEDKVEVTITCATEGAKVYYTIDGSEPTAESTEYAAPFELTATTTVKAIAIKGENKSAVASITYTKVEPLADPTNCAEAREAALSVSKNNELYNGGKEYTISGFVTEIAFAWAEGSMSFWMADAADGGQVIEAYKCAIANEEDAVRVGDKVAVTGKLTKYNKTPEFATGCTVEIIERAEVVDPVNLGEKTIAEFLELKNKVDTCVLTGVIANVKSEDYGNFDLVELGNEEISVYVYGLLNAAGEKQKCFKEEGLKAGDTLTVKAIYNEYNGTPQVKDAIFVSVKKTPVEPGEEVEMSVTKGVMFTDAVEEEGWWQVRAMNENYFISLSNAGEVETVAGTYTAEQLDEDYSYVIDRTEEIGEDESYTKITFTAGSVTVAVAQDGKVSFVGTLTGSDGNTYKINIVYADPKPETTVNFTAEGELDDYIESMGGFVVGAQKDNVYVQVFIYSDQIAGEYTIEDLDPQYSYIQLGEDEYAEIYSATIKVVANADGSYTITADVLCYGDVLYKITVTIPGEEPTAIDNATIAGKIRKAIINGNVVIEKSNILYNVNGAIVR